MDIKPADKSLNFNRIKFSNSITLLPGAPCKSSRSNNYERKIYVWIFKALLTV
jgi:hypothetical protein